MYLQWKVAEESRFESREISKEKGRHNIFQKNLKIKLLVGLVEIVASSPLRLSETAPSPSLPAPGPTPETSPLVAITTVSSVLAPVRPVPISALVAVTALVVTLVTVPVIPVSPLVTVPLLLLELRFLLLLLVLLALHTRSVDLVLRLLAAQPYDAVLFERDEAEPFQLAGAAVLRAFIGLDLAEFFEVGLCGEK